MPHVWPSTVNYAKRSGTYYIHNVYLGQGLAGIPKGAAKSRLFKMLKAGHNGVTLNQEELDKIACWIDLFVPYCGEYTEANAWTDQERQTYQHFVDKRRQMQALETQAIRDLLRSPQGENGPVAQDPGKMGGFR